MADIYGANLYDRKLKETVEVQKQVRPPYTLSSSTFPAETFYWLGLVVVSSAGCDNRTFSTEHLMSFLLRC